MFVRACSGWSLGCGLVQPEILLRWAKRFAVPAVCVADFDNLYGAIEFYEAARREGVRPVVGAVVTDAASGQQRAASNSHNNDNLTAEAQRTQRTTTTATRVTAKGAEGAKGDDNHKDPAEAGTHTRIMASTPLEHSMAANDAAMAPDDTEILVGRTKLVVRQLQGSQVVAVTCEQGGYENLCKLITARHISGGVELVEAAARYQEGLVYLVRDVELLRRLARRVEPDRLFAEICDYRDEASRAHNYRLMRAAGEVGAQPVASHAAYFVRQQDWHLHRVLRAVVLNKLLDRVDAGETVSKGAYLLPVEQMRERLRGYDRALYNAEKLLERCDLQLQLGVPHFPKVPLPAGQTACARLCRLVWEGLAKRYVKIPREAKPRLEHELRIITKMGFADYFLVVYEIVQFAKSRDIRCVGRGSAADSLVTYCLGISDVDPLRYKLHFERFLNESRTDYPDIDLDFDWRRRDEVIRFVYEHWGHKHVAMICTQHYYKARSAFRDAARVLGMPTDKLNDLTGRLPYDEPEHLREAIATMPECRDFPMHDKQVARAIAIAERLSGLPRGLSVHVGGVVISEREITCHTPLQPATKGIAISQYDLHAIERVGLIKIDLLGHRSLAILADTLQLVRRNHGLAVDLPALPEDDPDTARVLTTGRTVGCFQIESPGVRQLLQMLRAKDMQDIIHALSLIRPGPSASGMKEHFIKRKLGLEEITYLHPAMYEVLADTYGVMLYQEDVMRVAAAVAGFTMATGDSLRKALEQPDSQEHLEGLKREFVVGAQQRGCDEQTAEQIWLLVSNFAAYAYNKAHACTYGKISYWCTYMKAHWPAEFLASVLNNIGGYYSLAEYLEEARRQGVVILPPDVNTSELDYTAEAIAVQPAVVRRVRQRNDRGGEGERGSNDREGETADKETRRRGDEEQQQGERNGRTEDWGLRTEERPEQQRGRGGETADAKTRRRGDAEQRQTTAEQEKGRQGEGEKRQQQQRGGGLTLRRVAIRVPLLQVRNLAQKTAESIVQQRKERVFVGLEDLLGRVRMSIEEVRALILSGACDGLGASRPAMLWQVAMWRRNSQQRVSGGAVLENSGLLFQGSSHSGDSMAANDAAMAPGLQPAPLSVLSTQYSVLSTFPASPSTPANSADVAADSGILGLPAHLAGDYSKQRLMELERQYLSFSPGDHPMAAWRDELAGQDIVRSIDLPGLVGRTVTIAGIVVAMRRAATKSSELMQFVSLEDRFGLVEVVLFPNVYRKLGGAFRGFGPYLVRGVVQENLGSVVLIGQSVQSVVDREEDEGEKALEDRGHDTLRLEG